MKWPADVTVGQTTVGTKYVLLKADAALTPEEARRVVAEILLRCDLLEANGRARMVDGIPRPTSDDGVATVLWERVYHGFEDFSDYWRDVHEAVDPVFNSKMKEIPGEFGGRVHVTIVYKESR